MAKNFWLLLITTLFFQEPATTDTMLFQARTNHINLWFVHFVWLIATIIDIWFGFKLGKWLQRFYTGTRFESFSKKWAVRIENFIGRKGEKFALILLGIINFPWANAFLASWLTIDYKDIFVFIFIGDTIWYVLEWGINLGVRSIIPNPHLAIYIVILVALLFSVISKAILNKALKQS